MIKLNFSFKTSKVKEVKPKKVKTSSKKPLISRSKIKVIERNYECIVNIDNNDNFVIIDNNGNNVPIDKSCYDCKNKAVVYRLINKMFITYIRYKHDNLQSLPNDYYPFKPGVKVRGNIIDKDNKIVFIIKKILK